MADHVATRPWFSGGVAAGSQVSSPTYQAYQLLHIAFTIAPIVAGLDKFFHLLVNWDQYLSPLATSMTGLTAHTFMMGVGVIEVVAGLIVLFMPRIGGWI